MSGIFGVISNKQVNRKHIQQLSNHLKRRGNSYSSLLYNSENKIILSKMNFGINKNSKKENWKKANIFMAQTNALFEDSEYSLPIIKDDIIIFHDSSHKIRGLKKVEFNNGEINDVDFLNDLANEILEKSEGSISGAILLYKQGKVILFSNTGSMYYGVLQDNIYFASEKIILQQTGCLDIKQIKNKHVILNAEIYDEFELKKNIEVDAKKFVSIEEERKMLEYDFPNIKRCTKCILPETFPHITFNEEGICNYCQNYNKRDNQLGIEKLKELIEPYKNSGEYDCIVPFSGGRDSCYALHIIVNELGLNPITYTYDWGMVTELARRNIGKMSSLLGVENIFIAADIEKKRKNIKLNFKAWLKRPHLGMLNILTAGDKHFFKYINNVKKETKTKLNIWGFNHLETTYFKTGFLGMKPDFEEKKVYSTGFRKQMRYQRKRFKQMLLNPRYINSSLYDTFSGEYYRSINKKEDYFELFDYIKWDEDEVNKVLESYGFEKAEDTNTTWRIGDGTAAIYNYVYYTVAGFTEHDTFRSNQIREGQITREEALELVWDENRPRYENLKWYIDLINMDYKYVIKKINSIPKLYKNKR